MVITEQNIHQKSGYKQTEVGVIPEDWEVKKLGEIFQFLNTANNSRSDLSENGEIKYIHYGDIHMKWRSFLDCSSDELPLIQREKVRNVPFLEDGDLVMADASEDYEGTGISVEVKNATDREVVAGLHTFLLRGNKKVLADGFKGYLQYIPAVKDSLRKTATGISVYGISKNNVRNISICLPDITEQRAIATVLSDVDALITSLDKLIAKKRDIKQATMQQLLSGKRRLPGFRGEWEVKNFGEVMTGFASGATPSRNRPDFYKGNIRWITSGELNYNIIMDTIEKISVEAVSKTNLKLLSKGTFLMAITGLEAEGTRGSCGIVGAEATTNQSCMALFPIKELSTSYLFHYYVYKGKSLALQYCQGTKQQSYTGKIVKLLPILLPPLPEQQAIAAVLSDMDAEIAALEQKREKTRALKQGMMQELLTGKTRLLPDPA